MGLDFKVEIMGSIKRFARRVLMNGLFLKCNVSLSVVLWALLLPAMPVEADDRDSLTTRYINQEQGFPGRACKRPVQDERGFIWMPGRGGLVRYDGQRFHQITRAAMGLSGMDPLNVERAPDGKLWVFRSDQRFLRQVLGRWHEIRIVDPITEDIRTLKAYYPDLPFPEDAIYNIHLSKKRAWLGLRNGEIWLHEGEGWRLVFSNGGDFPVGPMIEDAVDRLYFAGPRRLIILQKKGGQWEARSEPISFVIRELAVFSHEGVLLYQEPWLTNGSVKPTIWFRSNQGPVVPLQMAEEEILTPVKRGPDSTLWLLGLKTEQLSCLRVQEGQLVVVKKVKVPGNLIKDIILHQNYFSPQNQLWVSRYDGYAVLDFQSLPFQTLLAGEGFSTRSIGRLDSVHFLVNTYRGVVRLNRKRGDYELIPTAQKNVPFGQQITGEYIWIGGHSPHLSTLTRGELSEVRRVRFKEEPSGKLRTEVLLPFADDHGKIWVGLSAGLGLHKPGEDHIRPFSGFGAHSALKSAFVYQFFPEGSEILLATSRGIFFLDPGEERILRHLPGPNGGEVSFIFQDRRGAGWVLQPNTGLFRWRRETKDFEKKELSPAPSFNNLHAIYEDGAGRFWMPSDQGLICYHPESGKVNYYTKEDGLANDEFNRHAHLEADGYFYFGGLNGITFFRPEAAPAVVPVRKDIHLIGAVHINPGNGKQEDCLRELIAGETLRLPSGARALNLEFTVPDMRSSGFQYAYQIVGYDQEKAPLEDNRVRLAQLPYGRQEIRIYAESRSGPPVFGEMRIAYYLPRPFYLHPVFLVVLAAGLAVVGYRINRWRLNSALRENQRLEAEVARRTAELVKAREQAEQQNRELKQLNHTKDRLFGVIGHELKGPLLSLSGLSEKMNYLIRMGRWADIDRLSDALDRHVGQTQHLLHNLLRWGQLQLGQPDGRPEAVRLLQEVRILTAEIAPTLRKKKLEVEVDINAAHVVRFDPGALTVVLRNLINNAAKFSPPGGKIAISSAARGEQIELVVQDYGFGMSADQVAGLFDDTTFISTTGTSGERGSGLGLKICKELVRLNRGRIEAESRPRQGTTIRLTMQQAS